MMGAGFARQVRQLYPTCYEYYADQCRNGAVNLGQVVQWHDGNPAGVTPESPLVFNMITQVEPGPFAEQQAIRDATINALSSLDSINKRFGFGIDFLYIPRIGAGIGGLEWSEVIQTLQLAEDSILGGPQLMICSI
jgi:O-acetyl-ADP-ribose deacetylase (regulator of RNase III)